MPNKYGQRWHYIMRQWKKRENVREIQRIGRAYAGLF